MGKYIYEGHLGGLYCESEKRDYSDLYCEQCGDSDTELGFANSFEEAWELLKPHTSTFDASICDTCVHNEDYDYCNEHCEDYECSGGYSISYIMKFLFDNFECKNTHYIYLISRHIDSSDWILVNHASNFGGVHLLPMAVCPLEQYVSMIANDLTLFLDGPCKDLKEVTSYNDETMIVHIYECVEDYDEEYPKIEWKDVASYKGDSWYGYVSKDKINLKDEQKVLSKYL